MKKVAVLGGGMAGLAAAWALSDGTGPDEVEITVYQRGWRLGGKGASSRGVHGRIEEHGLHVWLGYYDNAFALLQEVYAELDRPRTDPACPIATWRDAVAPSGTVGVEDSSGGPWSHWVAEFGRNGEEPGSAEVGAPPLSVATFVRRGLRLLVDLAASLAPRAGPQLVLSGSPRRPTPGAGGLLKQAEVAVTVGIAEAVRMLGDAVAQAPATFGAPVLDVLDEVRTEIDRHVHRDDATRRTGQIADLVVSCLKGVLTDGLVTDRAGFAAIDHLDFRDWLRSHGASPQTLDSPLVRGLYDLVFAYEDGDTARPRFAAGLGLFLAGKLFFSYRGAVFWQLQAGMGDVVFAPLYQALRARGVRFAFFHRVDQLHLDASGTRIGAVTLGRQARPVGEYRPLVRVRGLPCFPARPPEEQLAGPVADDLESHWSDRRTEERVRLVAGAEFDDVVLATSAGMLPHVCAELIDHSPRWRAMAGGLATVATQSLQVWLRAGERELGWPHPGATVSGYVTPFDTYASMSHLVEREDWPDADRPRSIGYFCSVLPSAAADDPVAAHEGVRANAAEFLDRHVGHFWPGAVEAGGFRRSLLCGQYFRANVDPSDRYVQSLPGTGTLRLRADRSGYDNLFLAGDWIDCGLNAGCIEAAVMAGIQAANAVRRRPVTSGIRGAWCDLTS